MRVGTDSSVRPAWGMAGVGFVSFVRRGTEKSVPGGMVAPVGIATDLFTASRVVSPRSLARRELGMLLQLFLALLRLGGGF